MLYDVVVAAAVGVVVVFTLNCSFYPTTSPAAHLESVLLILKRIESRVPFSDWTP